MKDLQCIMLCGFPCPMLSSVLSRFDGNWTMIPFVQCIDTPVNVSGLMSLLSHINVTKKES